MLRHRCGAQYTSRGREVPVQDYLGAAEPLRFLVVAVPRQLGTEIEPKRDWSAFPLHLLIRLLLEGSSTRIQVKDVTL